jgi:hypothetical protein
MNIKKKQWRSILKWMRNRGIKQEENMSKQEKIKSNTAYRIKMAKKLWDE